jgi:hypothetical protein
VEHYFKIWDNKTNSFLNNGKSMSLQNIVDCSEFSTIIDSFSTALLVSDKKDINNILITEGDLVEVIINKQPHGFGKFEVIYKDSAFRLKEIEQNWAMILQEDNCLADFEEIKIIGNIFKKEVDNSDVL